MFWSVELRKGIPGSGSIISVPASSFVPKFSIATVTYVAFWFKLISTLLIMRTEFQSNPESLGRNFSFLGEGGGEWKSFKKGS